MLDKIKNGGRLAGLSSILYEFSGKKGSLAMNRKKLTLYGVLILLCVCLVWWRRKLAAIAAVFVYAGAFTLLLAPLCIRLEKRGLSCAKASLVSFMCFLLTFAILVSVFVPYLISQIVMLIQRIMPIVTALIGACGRWGGMTWLLESFPSGETLAETAGTIASVFAKGSAFVVAQTGRIAIALVIAYHFLLERKSLSSKMLLCVPLEKRKLFLLMLSGCRNAVLACLAGMMKTSIFIAAATFIGLVFLRVQNAFLLAVLMAIMELLPYIGPVLASIPILLSCIPYGIEKTLMALGLVLLVQQIESNLVSPYFAASSTSIHPLTALISVFVLGSLVGIWGIVLAVPLVVTIKSIFWTARQYAASEKVEKSFAS